MSTSTWVAFLRGINVGGSSGHRKPQPPRDPDVEALNRIKAARESFVLRGDAFYLHAPTSAMADEFRRRDASTWGSR